MSGRDTLARSQEETSLSQSKSGAGGRTNPALRLRTVRDVHTYLGVFFAPTLLFFAATGALQLFKLHESHGAYAPYAIVDKLGQLHKEQLFEAKPKRPPPKADDAAKKAEAPKPKEPPKADPPSQTVLKWFFLAAAVSLITSTLLGLWMALAHSRRPKLALLLLALGIAAPFLILNLL